MQTSTTVSIRIRGCMNKTSSVTSSAIVLWEQMCSIQLMQMFREQVDDTMIYIYIHTINDSIRYAHKTGEIK